MAEQWYVLREGEQLGPFDAHQLERLMSNGSLLTTDTVRRVEEERPVVQKLDIAIFAPANVSHTPKLHHSRNERVIAFAILLFVFLGGQALWNVWTYLSPPTRPTPSQYLGADGFNSRSNHEGTAWERKLNSTSYDERVRLWADQFGKSEAWVRSLTSPNDSTASGNVKLVRQSIIDDARQDVADGVWTPDKYREWTGQEY